MDFDFLDCFLDISIKFMNGTKAGIKIFIEKDGVSSRVKQDCRKMSPPPLEDSDIENLLDLIFDNYGYLHKRDLYKRFFQEYGYELEMEQENLTAIFCESDIVETSDGALFCRKYVKKNKGLLPVYGFTPDEKKKYDDASKSKYICF